MARMLGRVSPPWCPICNKPPRIDCPDFSKSKKQVRYRERREWRRDWEGDPKLVLGPDC